MKRSARVSTYALLAFSAVLFTGCWGDPYSSSYTSSKPLEKDIVGNWIPDEKTLRDLRDRGGYDTSRVMPKLVLRANGDLEMISMPDWWNEPFGKSLKGFQSSSGTWKLVQHGDKAWWELELDLRNRGSRIVRLRGESAPYLIHFTLGDPDMGDAMVFVRLDE